MKKIWAKWKPYILSILLALAVGGLASFLTRGEMKLYESGIIRKPPLSPPGWLFGVVWTILYVLMGISAATVYVRRQENPPLATDALTVYGVSLAVNFAWTILFFKCRAFLFAFLWLLLLWGLICAVIVLFKKLRPAAGYLQIPYLLWVTFAGYLNFAVWLLNRA